jgi:hypothetical protein
MANNGESGGGRWRPVWWAAGGAVVGGAAVALAVLFMAAATIVVLAARNRDDQVVLSRNEIVEDGAGGRSWRGAMTNRTGESYQDVSVAILFRDAQGMPLGWTSGQADVLGGGESIDLQAPLPAGAADMQMYALRWRDAGDRIAFGPYKPWAFGYLQEPD